MAGILRDTLRQRPDYTQKFNVGAKRHGWLRLTPAYSAKIVEEILQNQRRNCRILDPFCGTGTTALCAVNQGLSATTTDINPFLIWLARSKTACYSEGSLGLAREIGRAALSAQTRETVPPISPPPMHNIERWWAEDIRYFLCYLRAAIQTLSARAGSAADLLDIAFCRVLVRLSNATFNHQSISFKDPRQYQLSLSNELGNTFLDELEFVLQGANENPPTSATVILGDSRDLRLHVDSSFDLVVTSPPYANRMSYIRELRPYMYWLGYLANGRDAAELDWLAIGGTWGSATSRLATWEPSDHWPIHRYLAAILTAIANQGNKNGVLLANYVGKYCEDMFRHFECLPHVLNPGARIHYIVGNSTFYGVLVPTEQIYASMMRDCGFVDVEIKPIRKRNSKKELIEFNVSATWPW